MHTTLCARGPVERFTLSPHIILPSLTPPRLHASLSGMAEETLDPASEVSHDISFEAGFDKPYRPTKAEVYSALVGSKGNLAKAARELRSTRRIVQDLANATPEIVTLLEDLREERVDISEDNIYADVDKGDQSASRFVLQTIGKKRGWAQGVEGTGKNGAVEVTIRTFNEDAA